MVEKNISTMGCEFSNIGENVECLIEQRMKVGIYRCVKYDLRNGPVGIGSSIFWLDSDKHEVSVRGDISRFIGVSILAMKWNFIYRIMWYLTGKKESSRYSPIRYFWIQEQGYFL